MQFVIDTRLSDSSFVKAIWRTHSVGGGEFISPASNTIEMVVTKQQRSISITIRGPETKAAPAPIPEDAEFMGIVFKLGTYMPYLPTSELVDGGICLPGTAHQTFELHGSAWQFPTFANADVFVDRLVQQGLLAFDPIVEAALHGQVCGLSARSVQRRFLRATGLTYGMVYQIERARTALALLQHGTSILATVTQAGYYDQPHMTRALKHLLGLTPAQIRDTQGNE